MNIIILGCPGVGKGTQGELIAKNYPFIRIIAGEILRNESKSGSKLGNKISSIIDKGNLVPDEMITEMIRNYLSKVLIPEGYGLIFDGYPRTIQQAFSLNEMVDIDHVLYFEIGEEPLTKRLLKRGEISGRADDQDIDIIHQRFENYNEITHGLVNFYGRKHLLRKFEDKTGKMSIELMYKEVESFLQPEL